MDASQNVCILSDTFTVGEQAPAQTASIEPAVYTGRWADALDVSLPDEMLEPVCQEKIYLFSLPSMLFIDNPPPASPYK